MASEADKQRALLHHQVKLLLNLNGNPYYAVLLTVACLGYIVYPYADPAVVLGWLALVLGCQVLRRAYIARRLRQPGLEHPDRALKALVWFSFINGAAVGLSSLLFFPSVPDIGRAACTVILIGLVSGASAAAGAHLPLFLAYLFPVMVPLAYSWAMAGGTEYMLIGALVFLLIAVLINFTRMTQRMLIESFGIRFDHAQLVRELEGKQDELVAAKEQAEEAGHAKARVLAAASHDLRQPLHALSLYSAILASKPTPDTLAVVARHIDLSVRSLGALLNALLDLSRLDAGVFQVQACAFRADDKLERICADFAQQAKNKGIALKVVADPLTVWSDPIVFERILRNLVDNAIKYTERGSVTVLASRAGPVARIEVRDTGKGIPQAEQARVFEEFYQLDNPGRDRDQGLGLGLSIVRRLADLVNSPLHLESEPGRGSVFAWEVPLQSMELHSPTRHAEPDESGDWMPRGARVLVLDDESAIREGMALLLESWGMHSYPVANTAEAQRLLETMDGGMDLMIADLRLQDGEDGLRTVLALRARWGDIPVLLASGETDPDKLKDAAASGFPLLHKPVSPENLREAVETLLPAA